jgi:hypothetical protein
LLLPLQVSAVILTLSEQSESKGKDPEEANPATTLRTFQPTPLPTVAFALALEVERASEGAENVFALKGRDFRACPEHSRMDAASGAT